MLLGVTVLPLVLWAKTEGKSNPPSVRGCNANNSLNQTLEQTILVVSLVKVFIA
jgi:hypothetical protein